MNNSKKMFTCPMHPEVVSEKLERCPKCGMDLLEKGSKMSMDSHSNHTSKITVKDYMPLVVIISLIFIVSITLSLRDFQANTFSFSNLISYFMIGFFLTFSGFKLLDLKGFSQGYFTYDLLSKRWFTYGYIYPFIELSFGLLMILIGEPVWLLVTEIIVMVFSGIGVLIKLLKREKFQCACLGTFLKVPLTKVTLIEDFGMALLALLLILLK